MLGGVARGCVFSSAGESGMAAAFSLLSAVGAAGPLFLGPRGAGPLVDPRSPLSSTGDPWDMGPEPGPGD